MGWNTGNPSLRLVENRLRVLGAAFLFLQASCALLLEGVQGVANGADRTAKAGGDLGWPQAIGAGQQDLGPSEREGLAAAQPRLEDLALGISEFSHKKRWFHNPLFGPNTSQTRNRLRLH